MYPFIHLRVFLNYLKSRAIKIDVYLEICTEENSLYLTGDTILAYMISRSPISNPDYLHQCSMSVFILNSRGSSTKAYEDVRS